MARARRYHQVRDTPRPGDRVRRPWSDHVGTVRNYSHYGRGFTVAIAWDRGDSTAVAMSQLVAVELVETEAS